MTRSPSLAVSFDECLRWARRHGATVNTMSAALGCTRYRFYRIRRDAHWLSRAVILEAAARCMAVRGQAFQTTLIHFTGR